MSDVRIKIVTYEEIRLDGKPTKQEKDFYECWATPLDLIGTELYNALNIKLENTIIFKVRYCKHLENLRNKDKFSIVWQGRKYTIYHVDWLKYGKKYIKIKCKQVT